MATLIETIEEYTKDECGVARKWEWGVCDCIGLLFHIVNTCTGRHHLHRNSYVPQGLCYEEAVKWLHDANPDPLLPYLKYLVDDSGLVVYNRDDWNLAVVFDAKPLPLIEGGVYPINIVPGVVVNCNQISYIMSKRGLASTNIYKNEIKDFVGFRIGVN